jgi:hypothetical protein
MTGPFPDRYKRGLEIAWTIAALAGVIALIGDALVATAN